MLNNMKSSLVNTVESSDDQSFINEAKEVKHKLSKLEASKEEDEMSNLISELKDLKIYLTNQVGGRTNDQRHESQNFKCFNMCWTWSPYIRYLII